MVAEVARKVVGGAVEEWNYVGVASGVRMRLGSDGSGGAGNRESAVINIEGDACEMLYELVLRRLPIPYPIQVLINNGSEFIFLAGLELVEDC